MSVPTKYILIYVQHLLGSGHLHRVRLIANELIRQGQKVVVVSGGPAIKDDFFRAAEFVQLDSIQSSGLDFSQIIDVYGKPVSEQVFASRRQLLTETLDTYQPKLVIVESWPFGRGVLNEELEWFIANAKQKNSSLRTVVSIRDILQVRTQKKQRKTIDRLSRFIDYVMVHADPDIVPIQASFDCADEISIPVVYTGYIAPASIPRAIQTKDIIVSAGGGLAGSMLYQLALKAAKMDTSGQKWRFMGGSNVQVHAQLWVDIPHYISIEANRTDYRELLSRSSLLITQCGYNSMMDVLTTGIPSIMIPFEGVAETEQLQRAKIFCERQACHLCRETEPPSELLKMVEFVLQNDEDYILGIDLSGARNSAQFISGLL